MNKTNPWQRQIDFIVPLLLGFLLLAGAALKFDQVLRRLPWEDGWADSEMH